MFLTIEQQLSATISNYQQPSANMSNIHQITALK
jgi:hypothetical protein